MNVTIIGVDLAKNIFHLCGINAEGKVLFKKKMQRNKLLEFVANQPICTIAMEACSSSQYWARRFKQHQHEIKLIAPHLVKPYVKSNKNDFNDAQAIAEAASRKHMRFVPLKTIEQQDIQSLHRIRKELVDSRTRLVIALNNKFQTI